MAEPVKRPYRSPARAAAAAVTRERIREAAGRLFTTQGFTATTMKQVAADAGVGERTLYDVFPTKAKLFGHTLAVATVGDEQPIRVAERPEIIVAHEADDPRQAIELFVAYGSDLLDRAGDLIMISVEAAGADPDMRAAADAGSRAHHEVMLAFAQALDARRALRPGLDPMSAADILYALSSPHMHQLLRRHRGWSARRYRTWLAEALERELLPHV
ncbi:AcrR family transcriptional regulator [Hamadaea flava]|uniref:TetR/AcrR family transcriptional regulator n=1 Tax=Hamadaea flava TaxID=1742688 RepID=A0ABV8M093_9ACTN|nr:TetR/AcrR family transcriptional regulator [Hamadaea flava]MCP2322206.1 AcrR family transcriptional regulator [Hamadaea flava]